MMVGSVCTQIWLADCHKHRQAEGTRIVTMRHNKCLTHRNILISDVFTQIEFSTSTSARER
jgi:hypothetical protein